MTVTIEAAQQIDGRCVIIGWRTDKEMLNRIAIELEETRATVEADEILFFVRDDVNRAWGLTPETKSGFVLVKKQSFSVRKGKLIFASDEHIFKKEKQTSIDFSACKTEEFWSIIKALNHAGASVEGFLNQHGLGRSSIAYAFDKVFFLDEKTVFVHGWAFDEEDGREVDLLSISPLMSVRTSRLERGDLRSLETCGTCWEKAGFSSLIMFAEKPVSNHFEMLLQSKSEQKKNVALDVTEVVNSKEDIQFLLNFLELRSGFREVLEDAYGSLLLNIWDNYYRQLNIDPEVTTYGDVPDDPKLSIIVPLYGRIDFMDYQTAIFATDPLFKKEVELIYVLDDPDRFGDVIDKVARELFQLQRVPFRVVTYSNNLGYARANNVGAYFATSSMILLLNSDVFPKEKGWTARLLDIYAGLESPGALGCKLLFEDDAVQHIGMTFQRKAHFDGMWANIHPHKGLPDIDKDFVVKEVPAVTAACMLLEKSHYDAVNGLSENYVLGDFEDSDLCLKLMEKGLKIYYASEPVLYHLERQSQSLFDDQSWKFKVTAFNCWQHTSRWDKAIEKVMERFDD